MINPKKLQFWIDNELNVLFKGRHGIGKTTIILDAFHKAGLRYKYFSAATMDPWVDFIGVPKARRSATTGKTYLTLIRPKAFAEDNVDVIFIDEMNRAPAKVRNAVMELIQFKSINGHKFKNLKMVWAAVNPDDDEDHKYDVEPLDPAQEDRFQVHVSLDFEPDSAYFKATFPDIAEQALQWWKAMPEKEKLRVSPRRLEYALQYYQKGGDMSDILPRETNVGKLTFLLRSPNIKGLLHSAYVAKHENEASRIMRDENMYDIALPLIERSDSYIKFFLPFAPADKVAALMNSKAKIRNVCLDPSNIANFSEAVVGMLRAFGKVKRKAKKEMSFGWLNKVLITAIEDPEYSASLGVVDITTLKTSSSAKLNHKEAMAKILELQRLGRITANKNRELQDALETVFGSFPKGYTDIDFDELINLIDKDKKVINALMRKIAIDPQFSKSVARALAWYDNTTDVSSGISVCKIPEGSLKRAFKSMLLGFEQDHFSFKLDYLNIG